MKEFLDLATTLQVGTNRTPAAPSHFLAIEETSEEKKALVLAGTLDLMRRAGSEARSGIEALAPAPAQEERIAKAATGPLLEAMERGFSELLVEWGQGAAHFDLVAPHSALLKMLDQRPSIRQALAPALGTRGWWLAEVMGVEIPVEARAVDPAPHRANLNAEWKDLDWKERAAGVRLLRDGLSLADEPFLITAATDKRKEVREAAVALLVHLESQLNREIALAARGVLSVERKLLSKSLAVTPPEPESLPKALPRTASYNNLGPKALALFDLTRFTRPTVWLTQTGLAPDQLISLAEKSEYAVALVAGWGEASERFEDQAWADALFQTANMTPHTGLFGSLMNRISEPLFEAHMRNSGQSEGTLTAVLLRNKPLSPGLSRLAVETARNSANYDHRPLATMLDLSALPLLEKPWEGSRDAIREHWRIYLDLKKRLLDTLILR